MTASGLFLCGCNPKDYVGYAAFLISNGGNPVYSDKRRDEQGFEVCPQHGERMYGWRSPYIDTPRARALDYSSFGSGKNYKVEAEDVGDLRPHIYEELLDDKARNILARVSAGGNGSAGNGKPLQTDGKWIGAFTYTLGDGDGQITSE